MTLKLIGVLLIFNIIINNLYADDDWVQKNPLIKPAGRAKFSMSYISDGKVFLYGGYDADSSKYDYWIYNIDNNNWTEKTPSTPPPHIYGNSMSYIDSNKVLLFGGVTGGICSDTTRIYELVNNVLGKQYPSTKPPARQSHDMAYLGNRKVLLFSGISGPAYSDLKLDDTWIYDIGENTWNQIFSPSKPSPRKDHSMCYIGEGKVLLFGGEHFGTRYDDTWLFNLSDSTWTKKYPSGKPSGRYGHDMDYIGGDQVLLFGGRNGGNKNDTWVYDLSANHWILDDNSNKPVATSFHQIARTSMDGSSYLVLFGGQAPYRDETWTFGGGDYPLPVKLASFIVRQENGSIILEWITESEIENLGFIIERKYIKNPEWKEIATYITDTELKGQGSVTYRTKYRFVDNTVLPGITYKYRLADVSYDGVVEYHGLVEIFVKTYDEKVLPEIFILKPAYPNPFNPITHISYILSEEADISLIIVDISGRSVKQLIYEKKHSEGNYSLNWDGRNNNGIKLSSGIYFVVMKANAMKTSQKIVLLR